ncbi:hypothetical protein VAMP_33n124 [Candidatus Vampirococcus lugosii]|uniref:Uncharacterized protein n=1 Tax=Candidatus Vampirococcus lugosii TaxID=2789015 RepID=A0ABS5QL13_9BACT|nr:hypothetical protein [Candidatus Vampirococcus lugosii]
MFFDFCMIIFFNILFKLFLIETIYYKKNKKSLEDKEKLII